MKYIGIVLTLLVACSHAQAHVSRPPDMNAMIRSDARLLANICLGDINPPASEVDNIFTHLKHCVDIGVPTQYAGISCAHYVCNLIRMDELLDKCPPAERHMLAGPTGF